MLRSHSERCGLADYETVKKRILGSRYTMNFFERRQFDWMDYIDSMMPRRSHLC